MRDNETIYNEILDLLEEYVCTVVDEDFDGDAEMLDSADEENILRCMLEVVMVKLHDTLEAQELDDLIRVVRADITEAYNLN